MYICMNTYIYIHIYITYLYICKQTYTQIYVPSIHLLYYINVLFNLGSISIWRNIKCSKSNFNSIKIFRFSLKCR